MPKSTPAPVGTIGFPVPVHDPVALDILPAAVRVVDDGIFGLPLIDPLVVDMFQFVGDMFQMR